MERDGQGNPFRMPPNERVIGHSGNQLGCETSNRRHIMAFYLLRTGRQRLAILSDVIDFAIKQVLAPEGR